MTAYEIAAELPSIDVLRDRCKALAVLECVVDGGEPYYAYDRAWGAEPAFGDGEGQFVATAVLWRLTGDDRWHAGEGIAFPAPRGPYDDTDPDGSGLLEILLDDIAERYVAFAEDYYDVELDPTAVERIVAQLPLTGPVVQALNPAVTVAGLHEAVTAIGYPVATA
ncbi:hypothetical protein [Micromonospora sp. NPDC023633]|uniref:hypothetical protein n=1 Tax=Micromonospora sp. NPDC023633 TaxID=3154320 RepID=UPI0033D801C0